MVPMNSRLYGVLHSASLIFLGYILGLGMAVQMYRLSAPVYSGDTLTIQPSAGDPPRVELPSDVPPAPAPDRGRDLESSPGAQERELREHVGTRIARAWAAIQTTPPAPPLGVDGFESGSLARWSQAEPLRTAFWIRASGVVRTNIDTNYDSIHFLIQCGPGFTGWGAAYRRLSSGASATAGARAVSCAPGQLVPVDLPVARGSVVSTICFYSGIHGECQVESDD